MVCQGIKANGVRCTYRNKSGSRFCGIHKEHKKKFDEYELDMFRNRSNLSGWTQDFVKQVLMPLIEVMCHNLAVDLPTLLSTTFYVSTLPQLGKTLIILFSAFYASFMLNEIPIILLDSKREHLKQLVERIASFNIMLQIKHIA